MRFEMLIKFLEPNFIFEDERGLLIQLVRDGFKQVNYITEKNKYHIPLDDRTKIIMHRNCLFTYS